MKNVIEFPNQELIEKEAFSWVLRIEEHELTPEEITQLQTWASQSGQHKQALIEIARSWSDMDLLSQLTVSPPSEIESSQSKKSLWYYPAAACATLFIGILAAWSLNLLPSNELDYTTLTSNIGKTELFALEDGSQVWLNTKTKVETNFAPELRQLTLVEGEAHFEVEKDKDRPFEVTAGRYVVRAIGTAFSVRMQGDQIEVVVSEGIVEILDTQQRGSVTTHKRLAAGQATVVDDAPLSKAVLTSLEEVEIERKLSWREGRLIFEGDPLETVVSEVSRYTPINIDIASEALKTKRIGGQFDTGKTEALFEALEHGFGLQVTWIDENHVKIHEKEKN